MALFIEGTIMKVSALTSSLPAGLTEAVEQLASLEFEWIDVPPSAAGGAARQLIDRHGLHIGCVGLERDLTEPYDLASADAQERARAVAYFTSAIERTAELGASLGYLTPPHATDDGTRQRWCDSLVELGDSAARHGVQLCIEHFPGRLIPTVQSTLELLDELDHGQLLLLIDVGHCLISKEEPADAIRSAAERLGYVHFDDNDGHEDLHWGLLTGCLTEPQIAASIQALKDTGYDRPLCLEFFATSDSRENLRQGKALLERYL